jgi:FkbM family methyltransferase
MAEGRCFVLGVQNPSLDADEILPFAEALPFQSFLWNADLPEALGPDANTVWLSSRSFLLENFHSIQKVTLALSDKASIDTYLAILLYRFTGRRADYPPHDLPTQYLPPDLPGFSRPIVFVDGGAYTGDTAMMLQKKGVELSGWVAFEPDEANFAELVKTARASGVPASLFPCGLSDRLEQARFENNLGVGSRLVGSGVDNTTVIQCVAFDDVAQNVIPDFIKLDVEGAEIAALNGMARTIAANRPRLAVSAYHKPQDLWEIPLKLLDLLPDANLHIRQHAISCWETVAYAIPRT